MRGKVEAAYEAVANFSAGNLFMPQQGKITEAMITQMTRLINEYNNDAPTRDIALKMLFMMPKLLLQKEHFKSKKKENTKALERRMDKWQKGNIEELVKEAEAIQSRIQTQKKNRPQEDSPRVFRRKMEEGKVTQAARLLQAKEERQLLQLTEEVIEKLKQKHPEGAQATPESLLPGIKETVHEIIFKSITGEKIRKAAIDTKGAAGPSGMDANTWRFLMTYRRNPAVSTDLRNAVATLTKKMCSQECEHLEPLTTCRMAPLKSHHNDVRPIGVGEVLRRIIGKCVLRVTKEDIMKAAGNLQVCAGQQAGSEAAVHAIREVFEDKDCEAVLLVDASNAFNTLNRQAAMHNIGILCPSLSMYVNNTYREPARIMLTGDKELKSQEGTTQGDPIAMSIYALGLTALQNKIGYECTGAKHVAYADDIAGAGKLEELKKFWEAIEKHGPPLGYHPNATKSCLIVKENIKQRAETLFSDTELNITTEGEKYLGAVIGSAEFRKCYINNLVDKWRNELQELTKIAKTEPHSAYTNFVHSLNHKWHYSMRTIPT